MVKKVKQNASSLAKKTIIIIGLRQILYNNKLEMDTLAKEIGISKKTIYKHFNSKENLLRIIITRFFEVWKTKFWSLNENYLTNRIYVRQLAVELLCFHSESSNIEFVLDKNSYAELLKSYIVKKEKILEECLKGKINHYKKNTNNTGSFFFETFNYTMKTIACSIVKHEGSPAKYNKEKHFEFIIEALYDYFYLPD